MKDLKLKTLKYYSFILVALTIPLPMIVNNLALFILILLFIIDCILNGVHFKMEPIKTTLIILFISCCVSLIYTCDFYSGLKTIEKYLTFIVLPLIYSNFNLNEKQKQTIKFTFLFSVIAVLIYAIIIACYDFIVTGTAQVYNSNNFVLENRFKYHRLMSSAGISATIFALYMVLSICILIDLIFVKKLLVKNKTKGIILTVFLTLSIVVMNSFTAYLALGVILLSILFFSRTKLKNYVLLLIPIFFSIILFNHKAKGLEESFFKYDLKNNIHNKNWNSLNVRLAKWECALAVIGEKFPFGTGVGCAQKELNKKYKELGFLVGYNKKFSTHNQFLHYLLESGVISLLIFLFLFFYGIIESLRQKNYFLYSIIVLLFVSSITDNVLIVNKGIVFYTFFISLASNNKSI